MDDQQRPCPRCEADLVHHSLGVASLHSCTRCGGVWLNAAACSVIWERAPATAALILLADRSAEAATVRPDEAAAACPECRRPMRRTPVPNVEATIDTCTHGTWFDARELRLVAQALRPGPAPPAFTPAGASARLPSYGEQFDADTIEMVGEAGKAFLRFLALVLDDDRRW